MAEDLSGLSTSEVQELRILQELARPHIEASDGKLVLLDINPELYPSQRSHHLKSDRVMTDPVLLGNVGKAADPEFSRITKGIRDSVEGTERVPFMVELLKGKNNVAVPTNHGDLVDIAKVEGIYAIELMRQMSIQDIRRAIIVSRVVSMIGAVLGEDPAQEQSMLPTTDVLEMLCDDVFLSYPRTNNIQSRIREAVIKAHNARMRRSLMRLLGKGGVLLGVAGSGTKDKKLPIDDGERPISELGGDRPEAYRLARLTDGTLDILTHQKTYVVPTIIWEQGDAVVAECCDMPRKLDKDDPTAGHAMYELIARRLTERVPDESFVYESAANE